MRELKFRVYHPDLGRLVYWSMDETFPHSDRYLSQSKYPVQQYTGLKDKNGKEIYEGDIVYLDYANYPEAYNKQNLFSIEFKHGSFVINPKKLAFESGTLQFPSLKQLSGLDKNGDEIWEKVWPSEQSLFNFNICVVIGNILENPELLNS